MPAHSRITPSAVSMLGLALVGSLAAPAAAQDQFAWGENIGWVNFNGQATGRGRVLASASTLSGFAWGENVGWINFGQSLSPNPPPASQNGNAFGVNLLGSPGDATRQLEGYAWGENIGWINFNTTALGVTFNGAAAGARLQNGVLRGFAWGENVGWINLDANGGTTVTCAADFNGDTVAGDIFDLFDFLAELDGGLDFNGDTIPADIFDLFDFLAVLDAGCP